MIPAERRQKMLEYITNHGSATITQLGEVFGMSDMTVHRDLRFLETTGFIQKTYGGVIASPYPVEKDFNLRKKVFPKSKEQIGRTAASLINNYDSIILDASTTILSIIPFLKDLKNLTIFTTGVTSLSILSHSTNFDIHSTGGFLFEGIEYFTGPATTQFIKNIHVDKCFISASAISSPDGITDPYPLIAEVKQTMAKSSKEVIVCIDKSKFGRFCRYNIIPLSGIDLLITDAEADTPVVKELDELGVEFLFC